MATSLIFDILRYTIWQKKLLKVNLSYATLENETSSLLDQICVSSIKIKNLTINNPFLDIDGEANGGHRRQQPP